MVAQHYPAVHLAAVFQIAEGGAGFAGRTSLDRNGGYFAGLDRKRCLGGTFRCARGRVMFEADARASTHVDFRA